MKKTIQTLLITSLLAITPLTYANNLTSLFNKDTVKEAASKVAGDVVGQKLNVVGTWKYSGSAVQFESENMLQKASASAAAALAESKINAQLSKLSFINDQLQFVFNQDNTFILKSSIKDIDGTYTIDPANKKIILSVIGDQKFDITASQSSNSLSLLFNGDKLIKLLTLVSDKTANQSLQTVSSLLNSYDGMLIGVKLTK